MKKGIFLATKENIIIVEEFEEYCEILLNGEYKTVLKSEIQTLSSKIELSTLKELKESIFINCIKNPLSDILYSYNTNRLTPEMFSTGIKTASVWLAVLTLLTAAIPLKLGLKAMQSRDY